MQRAMTINKILELKEKVFEYVQHHGPILPAVIAKEFNSTNIFISALLSELSTNKRIKISRAKIGGSPLYYCKEQEEKLAELLRGSIGQKPREALDTLKEKKILRDRDCLPFERVALRELEDFAKPVKLIINDTEEIFWKWYMLADDEAKELIEKQLVSLYGQKKEESKKEEPKREILQKEAEESASEMISEEQHKPQQKKKKKKFLQEVLMNKAKKEQGAETDFEKVVMQFLKKKEIKVLDKVILTKNKEFNYTVQVPSNAGELTYFIKARNKKSFSEGDLLLAFTEGQNLKLPIIFISNGDITKKAKEYMTKNLRGMSFIKLEKS